MYSKEFLEEQKVKLLDEKKQLMEELNRIARYDAEDDEWRSLSPEYDQGDPEDSADATEEAIALGTNEALVRNLTASIKDVELALKKMDEGKYGYCENCHARIPEDRLRAYPAAQFCLKCLQK